jgi:transposase
MEKRKKTIIKQSVGIDIGKDEFYCCYKIQKETGDVVIKGTTKFMNDYSGFKKFYLWYQKRKVKDVSLIFVMEATGVYYENLAYFLQEKKENLIVLLPVKMKYFVKSLNVKTKTDKVDSKLIALYGIEKSFKAEELWIPPSKNFKNIRDLSREHTSLIQNQTAAKSQLHALNHAHFANKDVVKLKKKSILFYDKQMEAVEKSLKKIIDSDKKLASKIKKIETIKGVGFITIIKIISETNGFILFNSISQLVSYAGLDVIENESGSFKGKTKISKKGNVRIRSSLYMPALSAIQYNKTLKTFYERILENTEFKKKGIVAVMRKLLVLIYTLWKKDEEYIEDYQSSLSKKDIG